MPHCRNWSPTDWQFGVETALMKQAFWLEYAEGKMQSTTATEIRRREDQMGTTGEALRKLRIRYVPADQFDEDDFLPAVEVADAAVEGGATVTALESRRRRLTA